MDQPDSICVTSGSYEDTINIAAKFASILKPGDIVCLDGDLGSGKTAFTSGIAAALGMSDDVSSPTFTILHEYAAAETISGPVRLINHFDVYRLNGSDEFVDLGFEEVIEQDSSVSVIEWADRISGLFNCDDKRFDRVFVRIILNESDRNAGGDPSRSIFIRLCEGDIRMSLLRGIFGNDNTGK